LYRGHIIAVIVPAYNVERHIVDTINYIPPYVDHVIVVDDGSQDQTSQMVRQIERVGLHLIEHGRNRGVGAAIASGYAEALCLHAHVMAVMAGDGQMDPRELMRVLLPVVRGEADYVKGNRFLDRNVWQMMPTPRIIGNIVLSLLTKITSGYWKIFDSQCGTRPFLAPQSLRLRGAFFLVMVIRMTS
jgi:glycosyltransferase involved in cell wall biosynthesis